VLGWVIVKSVGISVMAIARALLGLAADPVGAPQGWKLLVLKIAVSVWIRELFTLSASRDLYGGAPAIYVNYLDYDIFSHAWGPRSPRALRALRSVDTSIQQLYSVMRRVPEHRYDLYVLSDHGRPTARPTIADRWPRIERISSRSSSTRPARTRWRRTTAGPALSTGIKAIRAAACAASCSGSSTTSSTTFRGGWAR
jgi:hypothetical protein